MDREAFSIVLVALVIVPFAISQQPAFAQISEGPYRCTNLDGRPLYLDYNITQRADSNHTIMELSLHENDTGRIVSEVSFFVTIRDAENTTALEALFHADKGMLRLDFAPGTGSVQIFGTIEGFQNALQADPGGSIRIENFPFDQDKVFKVNVGVFSIDSIRNVCDKGEMEAVEFLFNGNGHDAGKIQIMPEFGLTASLVMAVAIVGAIVAAKQFRL